MSTSDTIITETLRAEVRRLRDQLRNEKLVTEEAIRALEQERAAKYALIEEMQDDVMAALEYAAARLKEVLTDTDNYELTFFPSVAADLAESVIQDDVGGSVEIQRVLAHPAGIAYADKVRERRERDAALGQMREALEKIFNSNCTHEILNIALKALQSPAGREMVERVRRLEAALSDVREAWKFRAVDNNREIIELSFGDAQAIEKALEVTPE
jgi:hypothetical protein